MTLAEEIKASLVNYFGADYFDDEIFNQLAEHLARRVAELLGPPF